MEKKSKVDPALRDNFNTPEVLKILSEIVGDVNKYLESAKEPRGPLLLDIATYITNLLRIFGLIDSHGSIGFPTGSGTSFEQQVTPILNAFAKFRDDVRKCARENKKPSEVLKLCDDVRDEVLPELGVR